MKTDQQLQQDVITELAWEPSVTSTKIGVEVKDGVVTLAGHVDSYIEKWEAARETTWISRARPVMFCGGALTGQRTR